VQWAAAHTIGDHETDTEHADASTAGGPS
jgi:hypothetical protein